MPRKTSATALPPPDSPLLTSPQAAAYIGIASSTLDCWRSTKRVVIPYIKLGANGAIRYRKSDLDAFLASYVVAA